MKAREPAPPPSSQGWEESSGLLSPCRAYCGIGSLTSGHSTSWEDAFTCPGKISHATRPTALAARPSADA
jgi:hypothetical protein